MRLSYLNTFIMALVVACIMLAASPAFAWPKHSKATKPPSSHAGGHTKKPSTGTKSARPHKLHSTKTRMSRAN